MPSRNTEPYVLYSHRKASSMISESHFKSYNSDDDELDCFNPELLQVKKKPYFAVNENDQSFVNQKRKLSKSIMRSRSRSNSSLSYTHFSHSISTIESESQLLTLLKNDLIKLEKLYTDELVKTSQYSYEQENLEKELLNKEKALLNQSTQIQNISRLKRDLEKKLKLELELHENDYSNWLDEKYNYELKIKNLQNKIKEDEFLIQELSSSNFNLNPKLNLKYENKLLLEDNSFNSLNDSFNKSLTKSLNNSFNSTQNDMSFENDNSNFYNISSSNNDLDLDNNNNNNNNNNNIKLTVLKTKLNSLNQSLQAEKNNVKLLKDNLKFKNIENKKLNEKNVILKQNLSNLNNLNNSNSNSNSNSNNKQNLNVDDYLNDLDSKSIISYSNSVLSKLDDEINNNDNETDNDNDNIISKNEKIKKIISNDNNNDKAISNYFANSLDYELKNLKLYDASSLMSETVSQQISDIEKQYKLQTQQLLNTQFQLKSLKNENRQLYLLLNQLLNHSQNQTNVTNNIININNNVINQNNSLNLSLNLNPKNSNSELEKQIADQSKKFLAERKILRIQSNQVFNSLDKPYIKRALSSNINSVYSMDDKSSGLKNKISINKENIENTQNTQSTDNHDLSTDTIKTIEELKTPKIRRTSFVTNNSKTLSTTKTSRINLIGTMIIPCGPIVRENDNNYKKVSEPRKSLVRRNKGKNYSIPVLNIQKTRKSISKSRNRKKRKYNNGESDDEQDNESSIFFFKDTLNQKKPINVNPIKINPENYRSTIDDIKLNIDIKKTSSDLNVIDSDDEFDISNISASTNFNNSINDSNLSMATLTLDNIRKRDKSIIFAPIEEINKTIFKNFKFKFFKSCKIHLFNCNCDEQLKKNPAKLLLRNVALHRGDVSYMDLNVD
ncbi:uncharacterized protein ASCRUDRAFT_78661 [Ascoidea rubescens DSM 1968]|uniref:Uncharacterized protein n=1 Tax=Ascoidea rubescens DSM 1968 TaxID=1344418 RepID=A0A1D2VPR1_9ASCO|nr:hypothetical protein ASCRUDRAFT_78661 [Ascoidea rubescens DSM 1968]ODV63598.1 hypothetical protein ASCRUDRAFT_78661 [Ascoidea rubescens DSM 1968]